MVDPISAALAYFSASLGGTVAATWVTYAALATVTIGSAAAQQRRARERARAAYNASLKDREVTIRSAVAPRRVIYGRDKVSGPLVYAQSTGDKGQFLHLVIALAAHECDAIEQIWFNDEQLPTPDADGWINSGPFGTASAAEGSFVDTVSGGGTVTLPVAASKVNYVASSVSADLYAFSHTPGSATVSDLPSGVSVLVSYEYQIPARKVRIRRYLGAPGQAADPDLVSESGGKWTAAHKGTGICYLYVRLEFDQDVFGQVGVPNISAVVRGKKVLDPRTGVTAWTDNSALIVADWLRDATYGLRASAAEVPSSEVIAAANICDELVTLTAAGATQKRYVFGGSFTTDQAPRSVLEDMLTSMAGQCVWSQGRWLIRPGAYRTPDSGAEISDDDVAGPVSIQPKASRSELFNAVRATYRDPSQKWAEVQAPLVTNATYEAEDGGVRVVRSITFPFAMDALRAQRLAKIELERARQAVTVQLATNLRAYDLAPTDTALVLLSRYGWGAGKVFEVRSRTWSPDGALQYVLRETAAGVYAWNYGEATTVDPAPDTDLPSPYARPAALAGLAVDSGTANLLQQADGTIVSRASVTWTASSEPFVQQGGSIQVQWSLAGDLDWQSLPPLPGDATQTYIAPVPDGRAIVVRARAVNGVGVRGAWAYRAHVVIGKSLPPTAVAGFAGVVGKGRAVWRWTPATDADYAETEVRSSDANWGATSPAPLWRGTANEWAEAVTTSGALTRYARHFDTSGLASASSATASVTVAASDVVVDGISSSLSRAVANFTADSLGVVDAGQSYATTMTVLLGTADDTSNWTISRTSSDASITTTISGATVTVTGIGTSLDSGTVTVTAARSGYPTQTRVITVGKLKRATPAAAVVATLAGMDSDDATTGANSVAGFRIRTNGKVQSKASGAGGAYSDTADWYSPPSTGIGTGRYLRVSLISSNGTATVGGTLNAWTQITTDQTITLTRTAVGTADATFLVQISESASGVPVAGSGYAYLSCERS